MANVSVLNTTNQLSGKTVAVCENDHTISGAWTFTGNQLFNGNVTLGNAVEDTVVFTGVLASNLLFTDATYDVGASGANRPRDLFLSRNAVVGGTLAVTGVATFTAAPVGIEVKSSWTPSLGGNTTYGAQEGTYTRVGDRITARGRLQVTALGTGSATVISGLPVAAMAADFPGCVGYFDDLATNVTWLGIKVIQSSTTLQFVGLTAAAGFTTDPITVFQNGTDIHFSVTYFV